jgi:hypothetical protein
MQGNWVSKVAQAKNSHQAEKWAQWPVYTTLNKILELMIWQGHVDFSQNGHVEFEQ